tara:strand:- start:2161 stop:2265 length:105 start_codon:yes stop_codon:yes gene_type:complete
MECLVSILTNKYSEGEIKKNVNDFAEKFEFIKDY